MSDETCASYLQICLDDDRLRRLWIDWRQAYFHEFKQADGSWIRCARATHCREHNREAAGIERRWGEKEPYWGA